MNARWIIGITTVFIFTASSVPSPAQQKRGEKTAGLFEKGTNFAPLQTQSTGVSEFETPPAGESAAGGKSETVVWRKKTNTVPERFRGSAPGKTKPASKETSGMPSKTQPTSISGLGRSPDSVVLLGTYPWDVESNKQGNGGREIDFWWEQASSTERYLVPKNGAKAAVVTGHDFDTIDAAFVAAQALSDHVEKRDGGKTLVTEFSGSDVNSVLTPGAIVVFRTAEGNFGKLQVEGYHALHDFSFPEAANLSQEWKEFALKQPNTVLYHLQARRVLFGSATAGHPEKTLTPIKTGGGGSR